MLHGAGSGKQWKCSAEEYEDNTLAPAANLQFTSMTASGQFAVIGRERSTRPEAFGNLPGEGLDPGEGELFRIVTTRSSRVYIVR
jgi:hypothetical protein